MFVCLSSESQRGHTFYQNLVYFVYEEYYLNLKYMGRVTCADLLYMFFHEGSNGNTTSTIMSCNFREIPL